MEKINIKKATKENLEKVSVLEGEIWPEGTQAPLEKFESRLETFPEGFILAYREETLIGASTSQIIMYDSKSPPDSWEKITDDGWIRGSHNSNGNALYIVSIGAISRQGGGSALLQAQKNLAQELNLDYLVLGSRIPGYDFHCREHKEIGIQDYTTLKRGDGELLDPELRFYTRNGLQISKIVPNYMEDDKESRNYGAIMFWEPS